MLHSSIFFRLLCVLGKFLYFLNLISCFTVDSVNSSLFSEADLVKLDEAFDTLIALGFKIEDVAEESAEVDEETSE